MQSRAQVQRHPVPLLLGSETQSLEAAHRQGCISLWRKKQTNSGGQCLTKQFELRPVVRHLSCRGLVPGGQCPKAQIVFCIFFEEPEGMKVRLAGF